MRSPSTAGLTSAACLVALALLVPALSRPGHAEEPPAKAPAKAAPKAAPKAGPKLSPIAALLEPIRTRYDVPGMAAAVVTSAGLQAMGSTGLRRHDDTARVTDDDLWHIGSCTKTMTATLIGRLVEKGKLRWDMTLAEALPALKKDMHADWRGVTLDLLLRNRGGAPSDLNQGGLWARLWAHRGTPVEARALLARGVLTAAPAKPPGTQYIYSNAGFALAGHVAETVMRKPWEKLMQAELFKPLGMKHVGFGAPGSATKVDQPHGHHSAKGTRVPVTPGPAADNPTAIAPAARVHLSMQDWARFIALHLAGARTGKQRLLLNRVTLARLQTARKGESYAMGWGTGQRPWAGGPVLSHAGSNTMWYAVSWIAPRKDIALLVACNIAGSGGADACEQATQALIKRYVTK